MDIKDAIITSGGYSYNLIKISVSDETSDSFLSDAHPMPTFLADSASLRTRFGSNTVTISGTTETVLVPATPLEYHDISYLSIANTTNAQRFEIQVRDSVGGPVRAVYHLSGNDHVDIPFDTNFLQQTIGGAWTLKCSTAGSDIVANVHYVKRSI